MAGLSRRAVFAIWVGLAVPLCATGAPGQERLAHDASSSKTHTHGQGLQIRDVAARNLISELGSTLFEHESTPCDPEAVGSIEACFKEGSPTKGNMDFRMTNSKVARPLDGSPWGKWPYNSDSN
eukprot:683917-Prorocentrum_minimum.AAC.2